MHKLIGGLALIAVAMILSGGESRGESVSLPITGINLTINPVSINLGPPFGLQSTGLITATLQSGKTSTATFDLTAQTVSTVQFLQFNFPLLQQIGSPPPTLLFQEIGPVTFGINQTTGQFAAFANLQGGGTFDPGSVFGGVPGVVPPAIMFVNDTTDIFQLKQSPTPLPAPTPPTVYPSTFTPFDTQRALLSLPARSLPTGFRAPTMSELQAGLAQINGVTSSFAISGIFRAAGQAGDIPFSGAGQLLVPEPSSVVLLGVGLVGMLGYRRWRVRRVPRAASLSDGCAPAR